MKPNPKLPSEFGAEESFFHEIVGRVPRESMTLEEIYSEFQDYRILITGAGGTIGSALARRLLRAGVRETYFLDRDESALHALALNLSDSAASHSEKCIVGDVRDPQGIQAHFEKVRPDIVFHTAALKHLVMLERFPREGYLTNVLGTRNVINAGKDIQVSRFINVSTDKAANPASILGQTKRIGEIITREISSQDLGIWSSVRFGNVFASRGSVIETFVHQLTNNIPITLTHTDVTRFFMSHDEAANLILASAGMQSSGTYIQQMGDPVKIIDVINRLAERLGTTPSIRTIGLQQGEKLHEELFDAPTERTSNESILRISTHSRTGMFDALSKLPTPKNDEEAKSYIESLLHPDKSVSHAKSPEETVT